MKIAFYLANNLIKNIDTRNPEQGNPGIGGTEYNFITLPYFIQKYNFNTIRPILLANHIDKLPENIESYKATSLAEAIDYAKKIDVDIFIFRPVTDLSIYKKIEEARLTSITWSHNMLSADILNVISGNAFIKRHVCVSKEQLYRVRDHSIFNKSKYIFNGFQDELYNSISNNFRDENIVTYVGSIVPDKGFHVIAKKWKKVVKQIPDAKLMVIGTGKLYDRNQRLGMWGIAEERYEKKFMKHLLDKDGKIMDSVEFMGLMGPEKIKILSKTKVGVVNPTAKSENCPGTALEFQASGIPVVSKARYGLLDTVQHTKSGFLVRRESNLHKPIIKLLNNDRLRIQMGNNGVAFIKAKFNYEIIVKQWVELFEEVEKNNEHKLDFTVYNPSYNYNYLRELNRRIKFVFPFLKSFVEYRTEVKKIYLFIKSMFSF